jgi:cytoskeletal protein CcmA (bactofilin family)
MSDSRIPSSSEVTAILGTGTTFSGRLIFEGVVRIDGEFQGDIFSRDMLIIGPDARVHAQIDADTVVIAGFVEGEIRALTRVEVQSSGTVRGLVKCPAGGLMIENGAAFEANTQMLPTGSAEGSLASI